MNDLLLSYKNALEESGCRSFVKLSQLEGFASSEKKRFRSVEKRVENGEVEFINHVRKPHTQQIWKKIAKSLRQGTEGMLIIGIGGSSRGTRALYEALVPFQKAVTRQLFFLENVDPEEAFLLIKEIDLSRTAVNVITKSGNTVETLANFIVILEKLKKKRSRTFPSRLIVTTASKDGDLIEYARKMNVSVIPLHPNESGRFSVLGPTGLFPLCYCGIDTSKLISGARSMLQRCLLFKDLQKNPAFVYAALKRLFMSKGKKIEVSFSYSAFLERLLGWYAQLLAESTGKMYSMIGRHVNEGQTPLSAIGTLDQHSLLQLFLEGEKDKIVTFWEIGRYRRELCVPGEKSFSEDFYYLQKKMLGEIIRAEKAGTEFSLHAAGVPSLTIRIPIIDEYSLGQLIMLLEMQVFFSCIMADVDPFNQPGVELGKRIAQEILLGKRSSQIQSGSKNRSRKNNRFVL